MTGSWPRRQNFESAKISGRPNVFRPNDVKPYNPREKGKKAKSNIYFLIAWRNVKVLKNFVFNADGGRREKSKLECLPPEVF